MDPATALLVGKLLDIAIAATSLLRSAGVNYREVMDAQDKAEAEGRELNEAERDIFLQQAQAAVDAL